MTSLGNLRRMIYLYLGRKTSRYIYALQALATITPTIMKIPTIYGIIERRILVNFTVDPDIIRRIIPQPFRPKIYKDKAIVGICLIRLKQIRPKGLPIFMGISSENGAHRIAVEWTEHGETLEGVFVPRRDTSSFLNTIAGGRNAVTVICKPVGRQINHQQTK